MKLLNKKEPLEDSFLFVINDNSSLIYYASQ